jgi:hypothetical protein
MFFQPKTKEDCPSGSALPPRETALFDHMTALGRQVTDSFHRFILQ